MNSINNIKSLINTLDQDTREKILLEIHAIEKKIFRNDFLIERNKRDSKVNANFIKKTVEQFEQSNNQLSLSNENLKKLNIELENSNEELERFAYIASHDLKTPLNNIISFGKLLEEELVGIDNPKAKKYLEFITSGGQRMNTLIKNVLEFSKINRIEEEKQDVDLNKVLEEVKTNIAAFIENRKANIITVNTLPTIFYYKSEMVRLFQNLIENGIKYNTEEVPTVIILTEQENGNICLGFEDNGIGIESKYFSVVTKMFTRLHNQSEYTGSGLGLSICQKIISRMNGKLMIESDGQTGSKFLIKFNID